MTSDPYRSIFHRDGTVTLWDVYTQGWCRRGSFSDDVLASLNSDEMARVVRHCNKEEPARRACLAMFPSLHEAMIFEEYVLGAVAGMKGTPQKGTAAYWRWLADQMDEDEEVVA